VSLTGATRPGPSCIRGLTRTRNHAVSRCRSFCRQFNPLVDASVSRHACQKALMLREGNKANILLQHLITIGAKYSLVQDGKGILATDSLNVESHPRWSQITVFHLTGNRKSHVSPDDATVIPMPYTTVARGHTPTLDWAVATDVVPLPYLQRQSKHAQRSRAGVLQPVQPLLPPYVDMLRNGRHHWKPHHDSLQREHQVFGDG